MARKSTFLASTVLFSNILILLLAVFLLVVAIKGSIPFGNQNVYSLPHLIGHRYRMSNDIVHIGFYLFGSVLGVTALLGLLVFARQFRKIDYSQTSFLLFTIASMSALLLALASTALGIYGIVQAAVKNVLSDVPSGDSSSSNSGFIVMVVVDAVAALALIAGYLAALSRHRVKLRERIGTFVTQMDLLTSQERREERWFNGEAEKQAREQLRSSSADPDNVSSGATSTIVGTAGDRQSYPSLGPLPNAVQQTWINNSAYCMYPATYDSAQSYSPGSPDAPIMVVSDYAIPPFPPARTLTPEEQPIDRVDSLYSATDSATGYVIENEYMAQPGEDEEHSIKDHRIYVVNRRPDHDLDYIFSETDPWEYNDETLGRTYSLVARAGSFYEIHASMMADQGARI